MIFGGVFLGLGVTFVLLGSAAAQQGNASVAGRHDHRGDGRGDRGERHALEPSTLWHIRYVYDHLFGGTHAGVSSHLSPDDAQSFRLGGKAFVRYDPEQPSSSIWLGREELPI